MHVKHPLAYAAGYDPIKKEVPQNVTPLLAFETRVWLCSFFACGATAEPFDLFVDFVQLILDLLQFLVVFG